MVEVIRNIFTKLHATSFALFTFGGSKTEEEAEKFANEIISDAIKSFTNYADSVAHMQRMIQIWTMTSRYEGQEYRDKVEDLDRKRRISHDAAIANLSMLNRICDMLDIEKFNVNLDDRYAVGDWIGSFCAELFLLPDCRSMDDLIETTDCKEYTEEEVNAAIKKIIE